MSPRVFPATFHEPETATYQWVFVNGQVQVSPIHSHQELLDHAQVADDHQGPTAMGEVEVQGGLAGWSVVGNVSIRYLAKVLQDYTKAVGWKWGGLIDHIDQVPIDDQFGPKKSMYVAQDQEGSTKFAHRLSSLRDQGIVSFAQFEVDDSAVYPPHTGYGKYLKNANEVLAAFASDTGREIKVAEYPGGGPHIDLNNKLKNNSPMGEDLEIENLGDNAGQGTKHDDPDAPPGRGPWKTRDGKEFTDWGQYIVHAQELNGKTDDFEEDGGLHPAPNMDLPLPNNYTEQRPFVMPLASRQAALQFPPFEEQAPDDEGKLRYASFDQDGITALALVDPKFKEIVWSSGRRSGKKMIEATVRRHIRIAEAKPKDMLKDPVPFIYDIDADKLAIGHPGSRHSDIPGKFTPGGIVEGTYEPGGKVIVRTMTNMPWTVKHLGDLWYWSYPQMEITGVELEDAEGKSTKLAALKIHEVPRGRDTHEDPGAWHFGKTASVPLPEGVEPWESGHWGKGSVGYHDGYFFARNSAKLGQVSISETLRANLLADPAAHLASQALKQAGGRVLVVGGAIRDAILGKQPNDIDLMVTGLSPEQVDLALSRLPGRMDLTGKHFGVYRYTRKGHEVEVALPRQETSTGATQKDFDAQIGGDVTVEQDLGRRDFTANAMAFDLDTGQVIDPHGGASDVQNGVLKPVFDNTFKEDPTRLLRALSAHTKHGLGPDQGTIDQMAAHSASILHEPKERIQKELDKIFSGPDPHRAVELALRTGLLEHIFPEVHQAWDFESHNKHHKLPLGQHLNAVLKGVADQTEDPDLRMAGLLHDIGKPASYWQDETGQGHFYRGKDGQGDNHWTVGARMAEDRLRALKYPEARIQRIKHLVEHHMFGTFSSQKGARKFLNQVGNQHADDLLTLRHADHNGKGSSVQDDSADKMRGLVKTVRETGQPQGIRDLAVNGKDILDLGVRPGPQVGQVLQHLTDRVIDDPEQNQKPVLLDHARNFLSA